MSPDSFIRRVLWAATLFNLCGAFLFAFPASMPSQLAGLPELVPPVYRALTAVFILLFGGTYAWNGTQDPINRPMLVFGVCGKTSAFLTVLVLWLAGEANVMSVGVISGDLAFAGVFAWWLKATRAAARV